MTTKNGKRGRPAQFDRAEAIRTARRLFHANGYEGVGVAELGSAMGIRPPSLYAAFRNKQRLYELAVEDYVTNTGTWIPEILDREEPIETVIAQLFEHAAKLYTSTGEAPGCMVLNGARCTTDETAFNVAQQYCAATRRTIRSRMKLDLPEDAETLSDYVMLVLHGLSAGASAGWSKAAVGRAAESAAAGFTGQITPRS